MAKVTWPSRKETGTTTIMVFVMVCLMCIYFFFTDTIIAMLVQFIIGQF